MASMYWRSIPSLSAKGAVRGGSAVRPPQEPELRKTIGELHNINVITAGADATKENRLHRAERLEHRLQLGRLAPDLGSQRCTHAVIIGGTMLQVLDASQNRLPAARQRGLFPESIGGRCNSPLEFLFD